MNELPLETETLVRVLAAVDSLFGPWPDPRQSNSVCFAVDERRKQYLDGQGIAWRVGGDASDRKVGERTLGTLAQKGLIRLHKSIGTHRHVWLTHKGDDAARSLLEFYRCCDCWVFFHDVTEAVKAGPGKYANLTWLAERIDGGRETVAWGVIRPLLARGLLESSASSIGETIFTVRPDQRKLAAGDRPKLLADPEPDKRANGIYWFAFDQAEAEKLTWKPHRPNCCYVSVLN